MFLFSKTKYFTSIFKR